MKKVISLILSLSIILTAVPTFSISVNAATTNDGFEYEINNGEVTIIDYTGNATYLTIPSKISGYPVTTIRFDAFYNCDSITSVTIPNSVTSIGDDAFYHCDSLESITIPSSVTSIGRYPFARCYSLTSINVSEENKYYSSLGGVLYNKNKTELVTYVERKQNTSFTIPSSVTSVGNYAFAFCDSLESITIPSSVTSIGDYAFYHCDSLTSVAIPNSVTSIGTNVFYGCDSLTSVTIPSSVTSIGDYAFQDCSSLTNINVSEENKYYSSLNGVLYNKSKTEIIKYPEGKTDTSFTIPSSVTSIGDYAFYHCDSLTSVAIPSSVTSIGDYAFYHCDSLTSVTIPSSVTSIGSNAFQDCSSLTSINVSEENKYYSSLGGVLYNKSKTKLIKYPEGKTDTSFTIPSSVTSIGSNAFYRCYSLANITIPSGVTSIGDYAFYYCSLLKTVNYIGNKSQFSKMEGGEQLSKFTINYIITLSFNGVESVVEYNSQNKPILPISYTDSFNKHFAILGWKDKNGNKADVSTLTVDNMIPLTAITAEIPVAPALLEADLIPNKDPYLPTGNKYTNGFYVQGTQIRVPSFDDSVKMGLRFVNILDNNLLTGLKDGATDISYGTLVMLKKDHDGGEVTIDTKNATKVEGKKTFKHASEFNDQYLKFTVCVTGIKEENFTENIIVRPYITFTYNGNVVTLYGEQYENASLYSAAKLAVAEGSTENPSVQTWLQANIIDIVEQTGDNEFEL